MVCASCAQENCLANGAMPQNISKLNVTYTQCISHSTNQAKTPAMRVLVELLRLDKHPYCINFSGCSDLTGKH